jgi:hypothetical protein
MNRDASIEKLLGPLDFRLRSVHQAYGAASRLPFAGGPAGRLLKLIHHIDVWMTLWNELKERTSPKPTDPFVFDNPVPFPRDSVGRILAHYRALRHAGDQPAA